MSTECVVGYGDGLCGSRRVRFHSIFEGLWVPTQFDTYGFDVRKFDLGPKGPIPLRRFSRELSELEVLSSFAATSWRQRRGGA